MTFCCWVSSFQSFRGLWFVHLQGQVFFLRLPGLHDPEDEDTAVIQYIRIKLDVSLTVHRR